MATKPTEDFLWAESADPGDLSDPSGKRTAGYLFEDPWPHDEANYMFRAIGRYINWLSRSAGSFPTPHAALDFGISDGESFVLALESKGDIGSETAHAGLLQNAVGWTAVASDGRFVVALEDGVASTTEDNVTVYDTSGNVATREFPVGTAALATYGAKIACNGEYIAVTFDDASGNCYVYDYDGVEQFSFTHGTLLFGVAMDDVRVYVAGQDAGAVAARAYTLTTGASAWTYNHGANLTAVACDGLSVYVGGTADGSGYEMRELNASDGALGEPFDTTNVVESIAIGEDSVYALTVTGGVYTLREFARARFTGTTEISSAPALEGEVTVDDKYVWVGGGPAGDFIYAYPVNRPLSGSLVKLVSSGSIGPIAGHTALVSDGWRLLSFNGTDIVEVTTGRRSGIWAYNETIDGDYNWFRRHFVPGD